MLLYLFFVFTFGINAAPISRNTSDNQTNIRSIISNIQVPKDFNLTKIAKELKEFGIHDLKDDKHLEGLPLDRNGKVNPEFHREIFLGNHELFESDIQYHKQKRNNILEEIFIDVDQDHDLRLSKEELVDYVFKNIQLHSKDAKDKNSQLFLLIDTDQNGKITWQEYAALYVKFHKMNTTSIKDLDDVNFIEESFDEKLQQELLKIRNRWIEVDNGGDNSLNLDQFLEFRHPEIAGRSYKYIVDNLIGQMDQDDDGKLKESEFIPFLANPVDSDNKEWIEMDTRWREQQKTEFREMDEDHDGFLTKDELLKAYDPMNRAHINIQIKELFSKVDDSPQDNYLSLPEITKHADVFTDMRLLDTAKILHDDI